MMTREVMANRLGCSKKTIERTIKKSSRIEYVGSAKGGHWEITEK